MNGIIFNIQKFCTNDGPGIRTTVFLKGCPLRCAWCHNPESQNSQSEILFYAEKCTSCGYCASVCPNVCHTFDNDIHYFNHSLCDRCGLCLKQNCNALSLVGQSESIESIMSEVMKDKIFYDYSGGGITLSGGEPMAQFDFTLALLKKSKENGLHTCMETCGYAEAENFKAIALYVDLFLFDYKETNPMLHEKYTKTSNQLILQNLFTIGELGGKTILRCPIIPGYNDRQDHFDGIANTVNRLKNVVEVNVLPYHPLGESKCIALGRNYEIEKQSFTNNDVVAFWIDKIKSKTNVVVK